MHRSMMQIYVKGSDKAVELYQKAFDAELVASYPHSDGTFRTECVRADIGIIRST